MKTRGVWIAVAMATVVLCSSCSVEDLLPSLAGTKKQEAAPPPFPATQYLKINLEDDGSKALLCTFSMEDSGGTCYDQLEVVPVGFSGMMTNVAAEAVNRQTYGSYAQFPTINLVPYARASTRGGLPSLITFTFSKSNGNTAAPNGIFYANWQTTIQRGYNWEYTMSGQVKASADETTAPPIKLAPTPSLKLVVRQFKKQPKIEIGLAAEDKGVAIYCRQNSKEAEATMVVENANGRTVSVKKADMSQFSFG